jgi:hypothetical protein
MSGPLEQVTRTRELGMSAILTALLVGSLLGGPPSSPVQRVTISGGDYAFTVPEGIRAGRTSFRFVNRGKVRHEVSIRLLKAGVTPQQFMAVWQQAEGRPARLVEAPVGILLAEPGATSSVTLGVTLLPDRDYMLICTRTDTLGAPEHVDMGMFSAIHVLPAVDADMRIPRADTITGTDYAFRLPATVPAGRRSFAFVNAGKRLHEYKIYLLPRGQSLRAFMAEHAKWVAERHRGGPTASNALAVLVAGAGVSPVGVLELDMLAGREYAITCDLTDAGSEHAHSALGMFGSIRVLRAGRRGG